ncbi:WxL domain-containing protein [Enterococcus sp. HY326]|uniref:WxL domain-containing protein n=1 Tax=Enterococcus sp. HY326 TaxID=2971265 RepID=UPI003A0FF727
MNKYDLTARITSQFASGSTTLNGANLNYAGIDVKNQNESIAGLEPSVANTTQQVTDTAPTTFITNSTEDTDGYGAYAVVFDKVNHRDGVTLNIPTDTTIVDGDFNATVLWTLVDAN